jgi:hypothetical protein
MIADTNNSRVIELGRALTGEVTSVQLDCGLPGARKRFASITPAIDVPAGTAYKVAYSIDGGAWKALSGASLPAGTFGKLIRYRVTLTSTRHDATPRLSGVAVGYFAAPTQPSTSPGHSSGTGRYPWPPSGTGTGYGPGTNLGTSGSDGFKHGGTGFGPIGTITESGGLEGTLSSQRGWMMAQVGSTTIIGGPPGSAGAPLPALGGLALLGALYGTGAISVPLGEFVARLLGRVPFAV